MVDEFRLDDLAAGSLAFEYERLSAELAERYEGRFIDARRGPDGVDASSIRAFYPTYTAAAEFAEIYTSGACGVITALTSALLRHPGLSLAVSQLDDLCEALLIGTAVPIARALERSGLLEDDARLVLRIERQVRSNRREIVLAADTTLATVADTVRRRFLFIESEAAVHIDVTAVVRAGFDLDEGFGVRVDRDAKTVSVFLPGPRVIASETDFVVKELDQGVFARIDERRINELTRIMKNQLTRNSIQSGLLQRAASRVEPFFWGIIGPLVTILGPQYRLEFRIGERPPPIIS